MIVPHSSRDYRQAQVTAQITDHLAPRRTTRIYLVVAAVFKSRRSSGGSANIRLSSAGEHHLHVAKSIIGQRLDNAVSKFFRHRCT